MPCISTRLPGSRGSSAARATRTTGFKWTYHFFWGLEDIIAVFIDMWGTVPTNKIVGALYPNDADGNAWGDKKLGFPPALTKAGYTLIDPGATRTSPTTSRPDRGVQEGEGRDRHRRADPARLEDLLEAGRPAGLRPKVAPIGKALLFPCSVEALGDLGDGMSTEVWWTPSIRSSRRSPARARPPRRRLDEGDQEAVDAADRLRPRAVRGRRSTPQAGREPRRQGRDRRRDQGDEPEHRRGPGQLGQGPGAERLEDAARGRPVGKGKKYRYEMVDRQQPGGAEHSRPPASSGRSASVSARGR